MSKPLSFEGSIFGPKVFKINLKKKKLPAIATQQQYRQIHMTLLLSGRLRSKSQKQPADPMSNKKTTKFFSSIEENENVFPSFHSGL
jgi:hypothetical protein